MRSNPKARPRRVPDPNVVTDAEIDRQSRLAESRQAAMKRDGLVATSARFDASTSRVLIEMSNGAVLGLPVSSIASLEGATPAQLANVEVDAIGSSLRWGALDADVSVLGIIAKHFGAATWMREAGRAGGRATSRAKARAARANGAKGGRPKTKRTSAAK